MLATVISMLIVGLWHGSTINFVIFGLLHGVGLVVNNYWQKKIKIKLPNFLALILTFIFLNFTFVIFRADSFLDAIQILTSMFNVNLLLHDGLLSITYPEFEQLSANSDFPEQKQWTIPNYADTSVLPKTEDPY